MWELLIRVLAIRAPFRTGHFCSRNISTQPPPVRRFYDSLRAGFLTLQQENDENSNM